MMYQTALSFALTTCLTYIQIIYINPYSTLIFYYFLSYYTVLLTLNFLFVGFTPSNIL